MKPRSAPALALLLAASWVAGCEKVDVVAQLPCRDDADCGGERCFNGHCLGPLPDGGLSSVVLASLCEGSPPVALEGSGPDRLLCGGLVAESAFRFALCSCQGFASGFDLLVDDFDSRLGPYAPGSTGGSLGANGSVSVNGPLNVGGSLWTGGQISLTVAGAGNVGGNAICAGATGSSSLRVGGDLESAGDIALMSLAVGGVFRLDPGAMVDPMTSVMAGSTQSASVSAPTPCDCTPDSLLDIGAVIDAHRLVNDNAIAGVLPSTLDGYTGNATLQLPCGRYFLTKIVGTGSVNIVVSGRSAIFIDGDVTPRGSLLVTTTGEGEVDLFIRGDLSTAGDLITGSADRPARARIYVGGSGIITIDGSASLAGNLYAPQAALSVGGTVESFGSLFLDRLSVGGFASLHYDRAVLDVGADCESDTAAACVSCLDCRNQACVGGQCGACAVDSECCAPLRCVGGSCVP